MTSSDQPTVTSLEDTMLVAFLQLKGHVAIPWLCRDDKDDPRVAFEIQGDPAEIEKNVQAYHNNESIGVQDFVRQLRSVKSTMYNMKRIGKER